MIKNSHSGKQMLNTISNSRDTQLYTLKYTRKAIATYRGTCRHECGSLFKDIFAMGRGSLCSFLQTAAA